MLTLLAAAAAAATAGALAPAPGLAGRYNSSQAEIGAALELSADGRFRYQLDYGAVSESGQGKWSSDGRTILLTSDPTPKAPAFVVVTDDPLPKGKLSVAVAEPESPYFDSLNLLIEVDGGSGQALRIGKGETVDLPRGRTAVLIPLVPIYGDAAGRIPLSLDRGHRLVLRFEPNALGTVRFDKLPLAIDDGTLLLKRYDVTIRLRRSDR